MRPISREAIQRLLAAVTCPSFGSQRIPDSLPSDCLRSRPCEVYRAFDHRARPRSTDIARMTRWSATPAPTGLPSPSRSAIASIEPATNPHPITLERATTGTLLGRA